MVAEGAAIRSAGDAFPPLAGERAGAALGENKGLKNKGQRDDLAGPFDECTIRSAVRQNWGLNLSRWLGYLRQRLCRMLAHSRLDRRTHRIDRISVGRRPKMKSRMNLSDHGS